MAAAKTAARKRKKRVSPHKALLDSARHMYDEILASQAGGCALCGRPPSPSRRLDLDHDHARMEIRGLLCWRCNRALPSWMTSEWLARASEYVTRTIEIKEK